MANIYGSPWRDKADPNQINQFGLLGTEEADNIYGFGGDDDLFGFGGNDWLDGGEGADEMYGGLGDDTYIVDNAGDSVFEYEGDPVGNGQYGGYDTVKSYISYTLGQFVEELQLFGSATSGTGNALGNTIVGNSLNNVLHGLDGGDTLWGMKGNDTLYGDSGMDTLHGGDDN